jgi:hypothetical protein
VAVPQVDIEDPGDLGLRHFFEAFARVVRRQGEPVARIGVYGDSNWTSDWAAGAMRRLLQTRWGDAGHGFVSPVRPWGWYHHLDVVHGSQAGAWRAFSVSQYKLPDRRYGLAGIAGQSLRQGAWAMVGTAAAPAPIGRKVERFEIFYLRHDESGKLGIQVDGKAHPDVPTVSEHPEAGYHRIDLPDGPHTLRLSQAGYHPVRVFGVVMERRGPGVVLDNLSVTALNCWMLTQLDQALMKDHLAHRAYDLIIDTTGTNLWAAESHPVWMRSVIAAWREALPRHSCLLVSPPDHSHLVRGQFVAEPRMRACGAEKRAIARANGCAFWDLHQAMGGDRSIVTWARHHWAAGDLVHFQAPLATFLAEQLTHALLRRFATYVAAHPHAGCPD